MQVFDEQGVKQSREQNAYSDCEDAQPNVFGKLGHPVELGNCGGERYQHHHVNHIDLKECLAQNEMGLLRDGTTLSPSQSSRQ